MKTLEERFWEKVKVGTEDECWEWQISTRNGYGQLRDGNRERYAHRLSWEFCIGPIPTGICVLHHCDNRLCVNPAHLFLGTKADNTHDMMAKGRQILPPPRHGEANNKAKLTTAQVIAIREQYASGTASSRELGRKYSVNKATILSIIHRKTWAHI